MKKIGASIIGVVAAISACGLLDGCLSCNYSKAVYLPIEPEHGIPATQVVGAGTNAPLSYQWYFDTNGYTAASSTVQVVRGTNGALYYQWFKNTNSP